jgi:uncharacterized membrane protein YagU involved in acid resistance
MDRTLRFLYDHEDAEVRRRESAARDGIPALEVMADEMARKAGVTLSARERQAGGTALQWTTGIGTGVLYGALRDHLPGRGLRRGLTYGAAISLLVDEGLLPLLGFAPGPGAFPWQTHARGFAGHLVFGTVAETVCAILDGTP